jgi:hypothetical protein
VHITLPANQKIAFVITAVSIREATLEYQSHLTAAMRVLRNLTPSIEVVDGQLVLWIAGLQIADA